KENGVDNAKHGRGRADAEPEREYRSRCEAGTLAQSACRVAKILGKSFEKRDTTCFATFLFGALAAAKLNLRQPQSFAARNALPDEVSRVSVDVEAELGVHLALKIRTAKCRGKPEFETSPEPHVSSGTLARIREMRPVM